MITTYGMSGDLFAWMGLGSVVGFVSSMPIGPINAAFAVTTARGEEREGIALALAVSLLDGSYAFTALSVMSWDRFPLSLPSSLEIAACVLLIGYGASLFIPRATAASTSLRRMRGTLTGAALGIALYLLNPAFPAFWLGAAFVLRTKLPAIALLAPRLGFALGVSTGVGLWFAALREIFRRHPLPLRIVHRMTQGVGIFLIGLGAYLMAKRL